MPAQNPRLAVRAIIIHEQRLLLVNAYPAERKSQLWCAPGGGVENGQDLAANVAREVFEETGLTVSVGSLALVNEYHDPDISFHQVELFYRCQIESGRIDDQWHDPEKIVVERRFFSQNELYDLHLRPQSLPKIAFAGDGHPVHYDQLERIVF